ELGRMRRARQAHDALMQAWPDNVHARRLHEQWRHRTGWQVEASLHGGRGDGDGPATASPLGSRDGGHALTVRSPLLGDRWRIGAFRWGQWAEFDAATPRVRGLRQGIGLHSRHDRLEWAARPHAATIAAPVHLPTMRPRTGPPPAGASTTSGVPARKPATTTLMHRCRRGPPASSPTPPPLACNGRATSVPALAANSANGATTTATGASRCRWTAT